MTQLEDSIQRAVNYNIRVLMAGSDINQLQLAKRIGLDQGKLSARLLGKTKWRVSELYLIAKAFDVPLSNIFPPKSVVED